MEKQVIIRSGNESLAGTLHVPNGTAETANQGKWPVVVICHGFVGSRVGVDRLFVKAARHLCEQGYLVVRFDFVGCGESTGEYGDTGLDHMLMQTRDVLDYVEALPEADAERITLLGHSLGGAVALLTAGTDKRVQRLVMWAAVAHPFRDILTIIGPDSYLRAQKEGSTDHRGFSLTMKFLTSLGQCQLLPSTQRFAGDVLVVHGTADAEIPVDYCFQYQRLFWMRPNGQGDKEVISGADHTFSSRDSQERLFETTVKWLHLTSRLSEQSVSNACTASGM